MAKEKKSNNPVNYFMSTAQSQPAPEEPAAPDRFPDKYTIREMDRLEYERIYGIPEPRSRRLNCLVQPSLHEHLKEVADAENITVNEAVNRAIRAYIKAVEGEHNNE